MKKPNRIFWSFNNCRLGLFHICNGKKQKKLKNSWNQNSPTNWTMSLLARTPRKDRDLSSASKIVIPVMSFEPTPTIIKDIGTKVLAVWIRIRFVWSISWLYIYHIYKMFIMDWENFKRGIFQLIPIIWKNSWHHKQSTTYSFLQMCPIHLEHSVYIIGAKIRSNTFLKTLYP